MQPLPILFFTSLGHFIGPGRYVRDLLELVVDSRLVLYDIGQLGHRQRVRLESRIFEGRVSVGALRHPHRVSLAADTVVHGNVVQTIGVQPDRATSLPVGDLCLSLAEDQLQLRIVQLINERLSCSVPGARADQTGYLHYVHALIQSQR